MVPDKIIPPFWLEKPGDVSPPQTTTGVLKKWGKENHDDMKKTKIQPKQETQKKKAKT